MAAEHLLFNGINGATGDYTLPPMTPRQIADMALGEERDPDHLAELKAWAQRAQEKTFGPIEGVDPKNLAETGWGVLFAHPVDPAIREALGELLEHRKRQATRHNEKFYREYVYPPGWTKQQFLEQNGAAYGPANPEKIPYYLLIVGDPETIPYSFQYQMDVQYAVGRIHFDTVAEYAQYAHSVVEAETSGLGLARQATFFGVQNPGDPATELSAQVLTTGLAESVAKDQPGWSVQTLLQEETTKARLGEILGGGETPALLFTASHGLEWHSGDARQLPWQGALMCQDWPGPAAWGNKAIPPEFFFAADDLGDAARLHGLISLHFGCYVAGTPRMDDFSAQNNLALRQLAPSAFVSRLPKRLLAHPRGGALAVIGHVERATSWSFVWNRAGAQLEVYQSMLKRLMEGHPVGSAMEYFNLRYAELSSDLAHYVQEVQYFGKKRDEGWLCNMWTTNNDARNFVVLGDPAVRLMLGNGETAARARRAIETITLSSAIKEPEPGTAPTPPASFAASETESKQPPVPASDAIDTTTLQQVQTHLADSLVRLAQRLESALAKLTDDDAGVEIATCVSDDLAGITYDAGAHRFTGKTKLRALTRITGDGDTLVCVAEEREEGDAALWQLHIEAVARAQAHRVELLKTAVTAATELLSGLRKA